MLKFLRRLAAVAVLIAAGASAAPAHEQAIADFLDRIGGKGASQRFVTELTARPDGARESFTISSEGGKPKISGNSLSAITTGIGWYLNHTAGINLAWNRLTADLTTARLPLPREEVTHTSHADFRHYLNYCTFSYSLSTWTWERWQQEIDWMALHGINAPLQIVGLEEVWRRLLTEGYGYSDAEASAFVGGPAFMAWFGMNNLQGHGGPNPGWWYERQSELGRRMVSRMKELGIEPVLPGFAGMVPSDFADKTGISAVSQGGWCGFQRPHILATDTEGFRRVAADYYRCLDEVLGKSEYYSIDPFHEGGSTGGVDAAAAYTNLFDALDSAEGDGSKWVIQQWQWSPEQWKSVGEGVIPRGRFVVLDLYSDGKGGTQLGDYNGHRTVYCMIPNFGARTGLFGRMQTLVDSYWDSRSIGAVDGVGAVPEGIGQVPMVYDLLFEMAWLDEKPDPARWLADWTVRRYGADSPDAKAAWELLRNSALDCPTGLQGPHEAITCARPSLTADKVSTWSSADIFYDTAATYAAAYRMLGAGLDGENYSYDLGDITRQALSDYSRGLLDGIRKAHEAGDTALFAARRDAFLQLILDIDELLCTNANFMLGQWTGSARAMADEAPGTGEADRDWLEHDNARRLITTWGGRTQADDGGLHDYSYRQWGGMMKDFYYARWKTWFDNGMREPEGGWYAMEDAWVNDRTKRYTAEPTGSTAEVAGRILPAYISSFTPADGTVRHIPRLLATDMRGRLRDGIARGVAYTPRFDTAGTAIADIAVDLDRDGSFSGGETVGAASYPAGAVTASGEYDARVRLADGTVLLYTLSVTD